ncbi:MAG: DNA-binding domain-containing protein [Gammaproteobacteria bacterium]
MLPLRELQRQLQAYVLDGRDDIAREVIATERADAGERLAVYGEAYRLRLLEALETDYPALRGLMGAADFARLGATYIADHPSQHYSIRYFGQALAGLLTGHPEYAEQPWLAELARFEWLLGEAFDAAGTEPLAAATLARLPADRWPLLRLNLVPSFRRLALRWDVPAIWKAVDAHQPTEDPRRYERPTIWIIWRQGLRNYFRSLEQAEAAVIEEVSYGRPFADLCTALCAWLPEEAVAAQAAAYLRRWIGEGLIAGLRG